MKRIKYVKYGKVKDNPYTKDYFKNRISKEPTFGYEKDNKRIEELLDEFRKRELNNEKD